MPKSSSGRSKNGSEAGRSERRRDTDDSTPSNTRSRTDSVTTSSQKKTPKRDDDDGEVEDGRFMPSSTSFASSSRSPYSGVAAPSVASSYATANDSYAAVRPAELVRNESMADAPRNESQRDSKRNSKSEMQRERRRTTDSYDDDSRNAGRTEQASRDARKSSKSDKKDKPRAFDSHEASLPQNQFPGQDPGAYAEPYRPPGQATAYYNDHGESVGYQPGVRPDAPSILYSAEQTHFMQPTSDARPPPEPSSAGQIGAAASYFGNSAENSGAQPQTPTKSSKKSSKSKSKGSDSRNSSYRVSSSTTNFSGSNTGASGAMRGNEAGEAAAYFSGAPMMSTNNPRPYQTTSPDSMTGFSRPVNQPNSAQGHSHGYGAAAAAGLAASTAGVYMAGQSNQSANAYAQGRPNSNIVLGQNQSAFPQMQHKHRQQRRGPFGKLVNWIRDPDGVAQFEQYTEAIGVCKYCFDPGSSPLEAPRKHHYHGRRSSPQRRYAGSSRVDKTYRYSSSDDERRRSSTTKKIIAGGLAGVGAAAVGNALFDRKNDFDDTYSVKTGRMSSDRLPDRSRVNFQDEDRASASRGVTFSQEGARPDRKDKREERKSDKRRSRRRSSSSSSSSNGISKTAALGLGAAGLAAGAAVASRRRSRSHSPSKRKKGYYSRRISPKHSYVDLNDTKTGASGFGQFFSPSQNDKRGKHSKGFFRFSNESSSSSDADLAFGEGTVRRKNSRKFRQDDGKGTFNATTAAALTATGMALASESDSRSKGKRHANVHRDDRARHAHATNRIKLHDHETTTDADNDDGWYDTDGDRAASSDDGGLHYGGRASAAQSKESVAEDGGWWPWSTPRSTQRRSRTEPETPSRINPAAAAALGAGVGAVTAGMMSSQRTSADKSPASLPPMQDLEPTPTSEFMMSGGIAPSRTKDGQYFSSTGSVPLRQPQPIAPIGSVPMAITDRISDDRPVSDQDYESRRSRRRDSSPAKFPVRSSQVTFNIPDDKSRDIQEAERERQRRDKKERRRTYDFSDTPEDDERRAKREAEIEAELERLYQEDRRRVSGRKQDQDEKRRSHDGIGTAAATAAAAAAAVVGAGVVAASSLSKKSRESSEERQRPSEAKKSSLKRSKPREEPSPSENQQERIARMAAQRVRSTSPTHEHDDYGSFFVPKEIAEHVDEHNEASAARNDPDHAHVVEIVPGAKKQEQFDSFHYRVFGTRPEDDPLDHPWAVPTLALVEATPPASRLTSRTTSPARSPAASPVSSPVKDQEPLMEEDLGEKLERRSSKVTWGDHDTYVYEVMTPMEERSNPIPDSPEDIRPTDAARSVVAAAAAAAAAAAVSKSRTGRGFPPSKLSRVQTLPDDHEEGRNADAYGVPPVEEMTVEQREHISKGRDFSDMPGSFEAPRERAQTSEAGTDHATIVPKTGPASMFDTGRDGPSLESFRDAPQGSPEAIEPTPRVSKSERRRLERAASLEDAPQYVPDRSAADPNGNGSGVFDYLVDDDGRDLPAGSGLDYNAGSSVSGGISSHRDREYERVRPTDTGTFDKPRRADTFDDNFKSDKRRSHQSKSAYTSDPEDWERSPSKEHEKRSARSDVGFGTTSVVAAGAAAGSLAAINTASADDDFYSKGKKSKRGSKRQSEIFNDDDDVGSVISSPATKDDDKKARRRSKRESEIYDEDDDTRSVASSPADSSARKKGKDSKDKDEKRSSGIWGNIFGGAKSDVSTSSKKSSKSSKSESRADKQDDPDKKKKRRSKGFDFDDGASVASETARSSRRDRESTPASASRESASHISSRDQSVEDGFASAHEDIVETPVKEYGEDQSFLAMRPEMPHMRPMDSPMATTDDGVSGPTVTTENEAPSSGELDGAPSTTQARRISVLRTGDLGPAVPSGSSPTAVPINFRRPPASPATPRAFFSSPIASPQSPSTTARTRQSRPKSTEFRSKEFRPLYLVEKSRSEKTPVLEVDDELPSLPSSRSSSAHPSLDDLRATAEKQDYFGLADGKSSPRSFQEKGRRHSYSYWHDEPKRRESPEYLDSRAATPVPPGVLRERETKQREEREARERDRADRPKPTYEFHSPSELLHDPSILTDIADGEAEGEMRVGSPLPSVVSTQDDDFMSAREDTASERSRSRSRSRPRSRRDTITAAGVGLGLGAAAAIGVNELLSRTKDEEKPTNDDRRAIVEQQDMYNGPEELTRNHPFEETPGLQQQAQAQAQAPEAQPDVATEQDNWAFPTIGKTSQKDKKKAKAKTAADDVFEQTKMEPAMGESVVSDVPQTSGTNTPAEEIDEWALPTSKKSKKGKKGKKKDLPAAIDIGKAEAKIEGGERFIDDEPLTAVPSLPEDATPCEALTDKVPDIHPDAAFASSPADQNADDALPLSRDATAIDSIALGDEPTALEEHKDKDAFPFEADEAMHDDAVFPVQDIAELNMPTLARNTSYVPQADELNKQGNEITAFEEAFERAVRARGLSQSSSREDALDALLPKRDNPPFTRADHFPALGEENGGSGTPRETDQDVAGLPEPVQLEATSEPGLENEFAWAPTSKKDKKKKKGQTSMILDEPAIDSSRKLDLGEASNLELSESANKPDEAIEPATDDVPWAPTSKKDKKKTKRQSQAFDLSEPPAVAAEETPVDASRDEIDPGIEESATPEDDIWQATSDKKSKKGKKDKKKSSDWTDDIAPVAGAAVVGAGAALTASAFKDDKVEADDEPLRAGAQRDQPEQAALAGTTGASEANADDFFDVPTSSSKKDKKKRKSSTPAWKDNVPGVQEGADVEVQTSIPRDAVSDALDTSSLATVLPQDQDTFTTAEVERAPVTDTDAPVAAGEDEWAMPTKLSKKEKRKGKKGKAFDLVDDKVSQEPPKGQIADSSAPSEAQSEQQVGEHAEELRSADIQDHHDHPAHQDFIAGAQEKAIEFPVSPHTQEEQRDFPSVVTNIGAIEHAEAQQSPFFSNDNPQQQATGESGSQEPDEPTADGDLFPITKKTKKEKRKDKKRASAVFDEAEETITPTPVEGIPAEIDEPRTPAGESSRELPVVPSTSDAGSALPDTDQGHLKDAADAVPEESTPPAFGETPAEETDDFAWAPTKKNKKDKKKAKRASLALDEEQSTLAAHRSSEASSGQDFATAAATAAFGAAAVTASLDSASATPVETPAQETDDFSWAPTTKSKKDKKKRKSVTWAEDEPAVPVEQADEVQQIVKQAPRSPTKEPQSSSDLPPDQPLVEEPEELPPAQGEINARALAEGQAEIEKVDDSEHLETQAPAPEETELAEEQMLQTIQQDPGQSDPPITDEAEEPAGWFSWATGKKGKKDKKKRGSIFGFGGSAEEESKPEATALEPPIESEPDAESATRDVQADIPPAPIVGSDLTAEIPAEEPVKEPLPESQEAAPHDVQQTNVLEDNDAARDIILEEKPQDAPEFASESEWALPSKKGIKDKKKNRSSTFDFDEPEVPEASALATNEAAIGDRAQTTAEMVEDTDWDLGLTKKERKAREKELKFAGNWPPMKAKEIAEPAMTEATPAIEHADLPDAPEDVLMFVDQERADVSMSAADHSPMEVKSAAQEMVEDMDWDLGMSSKERKKKRKELELAGNWPPMKLKEVDVDAGPERALKVSGEAGQALNAEPEVTQPPSGDADAEMVDDLDWDLGLSKKDRKAKEKQLKFAGNWPPMKPKESEAALDAASERDVEAESTALLPSDNQSDSAAAVDSSTLRSAVQEPGAPSEVFEETQPLSEPAAEDDWGFSSKKSKKDRKKAKRASAFSAFDEPSETSTPEPELAEHVAKDMTVDRVPDAEPSVSEAAVTRSEEYEPAQEPPTEPSAGAVAVTDATLDEPGTEPASTLPTEPAREIPLAEDEWATPFTSKKSKKDKKKNRSSTFDWNEPVETSAPEPQPQNEQASKVTVPEAQLAEVITAEDAPRAEPLADNQEPAGDPSFEAPTAEHEWAPTKKSKKDKKKKRGSTLVLDDVPEPSAETELAMDQPVVSQPVNEPTSGVADHAEGPSVMPLDASMPADDEGLRSEPDMENEMNPVDFDQSREAMPEPEMVDDPDWDFGLNAKQRKKKEKDLRSSGKWPPMKAVAGTTTQEPTSTSETETPAISAPEPAVDLAGEAEPTPHASSPVDAAPVLTAESTPEMVEDPNWDIRLSAKQRKKKEKDFRSSGQWPPMKIAEQAPEPETEALSLADEDQPKELAASALPVAEDVVAPAPEHDGPTEAEPMTASEAVTDMVEDPDWDFGLSSKQRKKKEKDLRSSGQWPPMKLVEQVADRGPTHDTVSEPIAESATEPTAERASEPVGVSQEPVVDDWAFSSEKTKKDKKKKRGSAFAWDDDQPAPRDSSGDNTPTQNAQSSDFAAKARAAGAGAAATAAHASRDDDEPRSLETVQDAEADPTEVGQDDWALPTKKSSKKDKKKRKSVPGAFADDSGTATPTTPMETESVAEPVPQIKDDKPGHGREKSIDDAFDDVLLMDGLQRDEAVDGNDRWAFEDDFMSGEPTRISDEPKQTDVIKEDAPTAAEKELVDNMEIEQPSVPEQSAEAPKPVEEPPPGDDWGFSTSKKGKKDKKKKRGSTFQDMSTDASAVASPVRVATPPPVDPEQTQDISRSLADDGTDMQDVAKPSESDVPKPEPAPEDDWGFAPSRKASKKDKKKKRQSTFDDFDDFDAEPPREDDASRSLAEPQVDPVLKQDQQIEPESPSTFDAGSAAGIVAATAAVAGLGAAAVPESNPTEGDSAPQDDDARGFAPSRKAFKKDKKKKNRQAELYEPEGESSRKAPLDADIAAPPEDVGSFPSEAQAEPVVSPQQVIDEPKAEEEWGFTSSEKSSKKDKKKNRQAEFYEPGEEFSRAQPVDDAGPALHESTRDLALEPTVDSGDTIHQIVDEPTPAEDWGFTPSRKSSKKDKKKNRQAEIFEPIEIPPQDQAAAAGENDAERERPTDLDMQADPIPVADDAVQQTPFEEDWGFEQPKRNNKGKNRQAEFYDPVVTAVERERASQPGPELSDPVATDRNILFDQAPAVGESLPQADPDDVWGFTPQRKSSKKDKKKKRVSAFDEPALEQEARSGEDIAAFQAPTPPPAVLETAEAEIPASGPQDVEGDILNDYEDPVPGLARTNTHQEVDEWYASTSKSKKGKKKGGIQRADTIDNIAMIYGDGGEASRDGSRGVDKPDTIHEAAEEELGVGRKKSKHDKKKAKTAIVWEEEEAPAGHDGQRATSPAQAWTAAATSTQPRDTSMHDSDGSNVSESTRERRRRRGSPRAWNGEELPDLPRDRAMTPPPEHNDIMDTALGVAATLGFGANDDKPAERTRSSKEESSWSFANVRPSRDNLQEVNRDSGVQFESPVVGTGEHSTRDSGYEHGWDHQPQRDSLRPMRPQSPTSSTEDVSRKRTLPANYETPARQHPDPVESTSKDRSSVIFQSSPAAPTPKTPRVDTSVSNLDTPSDLRRSPSIHGHHKSRDELRQSADDRQRSAGSPLSSSLIDRASTSGIDRTVFSPPSSSHPLSPPRSPLQAIPEHGDTDSLTKAAAVAGIGAAGVLGAAALSRDPGKSLGRSKSRTSSLRNLRGSTSSPFDDNSVAGPSRSVDERSAGKAAAPERDMADYVRVVPTGVVAVANVTQDGFGHHPGSPMSPTRPPSITKRRSMQQIQDLQSRIDQLAGENRNLAEAKITAERHLEDFHLDQHKTEYATKEALRNTESQLRERDEEIARLQHEIAGMAAMHEERAQWEEGSRELETLRSQHQELSTGMNSVIRHEIDAAMIQKNAEIESLQRDLAVAKDKIRELQSQILARGSAGGDDDDIIDTKDEDYFDSACQQLCQHVQQWVLRFSKFSDTRVCRTTSEVRDEKIVDRFDNSILDGSDVDIYLADRVKRRDVFMSVVMTMIWEYVFTRYLFGMDREQRQKLKQLEKNLAEVGPASAVNRWRAITLTMLSKRTPFKSQCDNDTEAVALEVFATLSRFLPPPSNMESQIVDSLRGVMRKAVELSVEMRSQRQEYVMLPPLQPEYDTNGDLARKVYFNASLMNERSGETRDNEELEREGAVVRVVLFPLVVSKTLVTDDDGVEKEEEVVVCPAQVLVAREGKRSKSRQSAGTARSASGRVMSLDAKSTQSLGAMSGVETGGNGDGGMF